MKDLEEGQVEIVLAKGQMSPAQLRTLEQGTVVLFLDRCPGEPATMAINGRTIAYVEAYANENRWFFQVYDGGWRPKHLPDRLGSESLMERLSIELRIWSGAVRVQSIGRLAAGSVLTASKPGHRGARAELTVFGQTVAVGTPVISGEFWGIQVDEIVAGGWEQGTRSSFDSFPGKIKFYDFSRPDRFSMEQIQALVRLHMELADDLRNCIPQLQDLNIELVDQLAWFEIGDLLDANSSCFELSAGYSAIQTNGEDIDRDLVYHVDLETGENDKELGDKFRESAHAIARALPLEKILVDWSGDRGMIDTGIVASVLESTWGRLFPVQFKNRSEWRSSIPPEFLEDFEMIAIVRLKSTHGNLLFVYPYRYLRKLLGLLIGLTK